MRMGEVINKSWEKGGEWVLFPGETLFFRMGEGWAWDESFVTLPPWRELAKCDEERSQNLFQTPL